MYFKYPYSDMYALNLDWMIKAINEVREIIGDLGNVVNSVNGESGEVTISAEMVNATDINGTLVTTNDPSNQPQSVLAAYYGNGIRVILVRNNLGAIDRCFFLSKHNSVFNLVEYVPTSSQSGVRLINGLNGDVTLTGENIMLSAEDQRTIAVVIAALNNRIGDLSTLDTYNKSSLVAAINELVQTDDTIFEDIGNISELEVDAGNVVAAVNSVFEQVNDVKAASAYVEDGDTATQKTYAAGEFIVWKGSLYTVNNSGIPQGTAITGHVTAVNGGGLNTLLENIDTLLNPTYIYEADADSMVEQKLKSYSSEAWSNTPVTSNGTLLVIPRKFNNLTQVYLPTNIVDGFYIRSRFSTGTFSNWSKVNATEI